MNDSRRAGQRHWFAETFNVSRESLARFDGYHALLEKWQGRINLISSRTLGAVWTRHFADSAQLVRYLSAQPLRIVDIGSGAGFPGMVLAILAQTKGWPWQVHLVEAAGKKVAFLNTVRRECAVEVAIHHCRAENLDPDALGGGPNVVVSRALARMAEVISLARGWGDVDARYLFLKGQDVDDELTEATKCWNMTVETHQSLVDPSGRVVIISEVNGDGTGK